MFVRCSMCGGDVLVVDGCSEVAYMHAHRYGLEPWFVAGELEPLERCATCGARIGFHHHASCTYARCAHCDVQAAFCEHNIVDDPTDRTPGA